MDLERLVADTVILHEILEAVFAGRDSADLGPHARLGVIEEIANRSPVVVLAIFADQLDRASLAEIDAGHQRTVIAVVLPRRADIGEQQPPDIRIVSASQADLDRWYAQALRED